MPNITRHAPRKAVFRFRWYKFTAYGRKVAIWGGYAPHTGKYIAVPYARLALIFINSDFL